MTWVSHVALTGTIAYAVSANPLAAAAACVGAVLPDKVEGTPGSVGWRTWRSRHRGWSHWPMLYLALIGARLREVGSQLLDVTLDGLVRYGKFLRQLCLVDDLAPAQTLVQLQQTKSFVFLKINLHRFTILPSFSAVTPMPVLLPISIHIAPVVKQKKQKSLDLEEKNDGNKCQYDKNDKARNYHKRIDWIGHESIEEQNDYADNLSNKIKAYDVPHTIRLPFTIPIPDIFIIALDMDSLWV